MSVLVTGGAGYIGSHTCVELLNRDIDVIIVDNLSNSKYEAIKRIEKLTGKQVKFYETDVLDYDAMSIIFEKESFESVIHFAGLKAVGESVFKPLEYYTNNVSGALNILNLMKEYNVKNFVFSSSATVYGSQEIMPIDEDTPIGGTTNPYGTTKYMIELILKDLYHADNSFNITVLRYFNPVGAHESGLIGEDPSGIPNNLSPYITQVCIGKLDKVHVYGDDYPTKDGTGVRDYIHVVDLAIGHVKALEKIQGSGYTFYNLGTGVGISVLEMIKAFEKASGKEIPYVIEGRRAGDTAEVYAATEKAFKELGFKTEKTVDDMCRDSWNWQSKNPKGYDV